MGDGDIGLLLIIIGLIIMATLSVVAGLICVILGLVVALSPRI